MIESGNCIVVLDACVLYQANIRDLLLILAEYPAELYQPRWSHQIVEEAVKNLVLDNKMNSEQAVYFKSTLYEAFEDAYVDGYENIIHSLSNQKKDKHVLAVAIVSGAQVIVTHNIKHFPEESLKKYYIEAQTPDYFLQNLLNLSPAIVIASFIKLKESLVKPSYTTDEMLKKFSVVAPDFTKLLSKMLLELEEEVFSMLKQEIELYLSIK